MPTLSLKIPVFRIASSCNKLLVTFLLSILLLVLPKYSDPISIKKNLGIYKGDFLKAYHYFMIDTYGIKIPTMFSVHGIDVSRYQQNINWKKVKEMKSNGVAISFAYIKATEGLVSVDPSFSHNWIACKNVGLIRGAYHYFKPKKSGKTQAEFFLRTVDYKPGDLPPSIDVEEKGQMKLRPFQKNLREFMKVIEQRLGVKPVIYTSYKFYQDFLKSGFVDYPCWIANYHQPKLLLGKEKWSIWQHSDAAKIDGIKGKVDFNTFNGDIEKLKSFCVK